MNHTLERWNITKSAELYGINEWGGGYFKIDNNGDVMVMPSPGCVKRAVSIREIVEGIEARGLGMPVLLRIENILDSQIAALNDCFLAAMQELDYKGTFQGAYPIKVNQQQQVIEEITHYGSKYHHGLEAGSKAELIAAMGMMTDKKAPLICNGYKDEEFVDLALYATKIGYKCIMVLEMPGELPLIIERSRKLNATPILGVRIKLATQAGGHWGESGGERSIFGLNTTQIIAAVDYLKQEGMLESLQLLHYHLGSQISNIREIRTAVNEACRVFAGLVQEGAQLKYLDLGGGLAVDYDGSQSNFLSSRNYTLNEYCTDIVEAVMTSLDETGVPHPTIITESGRALVAYYSMLLFNVLDVTQFQPDPLPEELPEKCPPQIKYMYDTLHTLSVRNIQECFNDTIYYRDEVRQLFNHGKITLRQRSLAEKIFWTTINEIARVSKELKHVTPEISDIERALSDIYYCNFSVFQSLPDAWAIDQLFPVMPIHRLNEEPIRNAIIADITCDCDGKIDHFIDRHDIKRFLPLHELNDSQEYYLGAFLVGAYQETLGDLHNLLGDTNVVTIRVLDNGEYEFVGELEGDSVSDILSYVEYDPKRLLVRFRKTAERAVRKGNITAQERREIMQAYEMGLRGYTYFER
ncbi:Biosynthetic arginine decarboxylase [Desulfamplus magnetovallimortis]|uniref:Biosynthetic arginine decarboxylase n=1 Tax=Desulfamplus magnetovallimortis TaxID=1246637 RepID=A0A1W1HH60_9BACT|nr:biosynthetic arginine decarboxylase [Desulfamplus magnetovallimortis]SLM31780.1 Biosynthetic arginine decarboxylase [Desulfamplus magnetovallimortis]